MTNEEAIEKLREISDDYWDDDGYGGVTRSYEDGITAINMAIEALKERKTGKWIITARNGILCTECKSGTRKMPMLLGTPLYKYCPFCGAKMEVDE